MKISVLMSIYDKEKAEYLETALESIVNQTLKPDQFVIIEDGNISKELKQVLKKYKKKYPQMIEIYSLKEKVGLGRALKYGVLKCKNEYIARMDSDDIAPLYRLEEQSKILENNPKLDILGGYIEEYDEQMKELISIRKVPHTQGEISQFIKTQSPFNHGTVVIKKNAIIKSGNYNMVQLEDYDPWARMLLNGCKMANTDMILGKNRTGKEMYKRRSGIKQIKKILEIEKNLLKYKIINKRIYIVNIIVRSMFALIPTNFKKNFYKIIRKL